MAVAICSPRALLSARILASWLVNHLQDHSHISGVIFGYADPWVFLSKGSVPGGLFNTGYRLGRNR